jgi:membrane protein implicated in regulation of membrane protease activity
MKLSKGLALAFVVAVVLTVSADLALLALGKAKAVLPGSQAAGYWAAFGFGWFLIIVLFSKALGHYLLERREDYYGPGEEVRDE